MRVDFRRILLASVAILCLAALLGAGAWIFRASLIEAIAERTLSRHGIEAELDVERVGFHGADIRGVKLTGEQSDRLNISKIHLDYDLGGLRARRIDAIEIEGGSIRAAYGKNGLTVAGFKIGGGEGGSPPVSIGALDARNVHLALETGNAVLNGTASVRGGEGKVWRGDLALEDGALDMPQLKAGVRGSSIHFDLADGVLAAEGALNLDQPRSPQGAADSAAVNFSANLTGFDPAHPFTSQGQIQTALSLRGAAADNPAAQAASLIRPDMWSGAPGVGGLAAPLTERLAETLTGFDAAADLTLGFDGEDITLSFDDALTLTGEDGPDIRLAGLGGEPALWIEPESRVWRAETDLTITGGPELSARNVTAGGQAGRLQQASAVVSLERFGGADIWTARDLAVDFENRAAGWAATLDGAANYSGELAGWTFDTLGLDGALALTRDGDRIHVASMEAGEAIRLTAAALENNGIVQRGVALNSSPDITLVLGGEGISYRYKAAPGASFRFTADAIIADTWRLDGVVAAARAGVTFSGEGGDFRLDESPPLDLTINKVTGESWTLDDVALRALKAGRDPLVRRADGDTWLSAAGGAARIGAVTLDNGVAMHDLAVPAITLSGQFLPDMALDLTAPSLETALDAAGRTGIAVTAARTQLEVNRAGTAPISTQFNMQGVAATGGELPIRMDEAGVAGTYVLSDPATADVDISAARISLNADSPAVKPFTVSGDLTLRDGNAHMDLAGRPEGVESRLLEITLDHDLPANEGGAHIVIPQMNFEEGGAQPQNFINPLRGLVANVDGQASGVFDASWSQGVITSSGEVDLDGINFATKFGPVEGVSTIFAFSSLAPLLTAEPQTINVGVFNPGVRLENGELKVELLPERRIRFEGGWPFAEGRVFVEPFVWEPGVTRREATLAADSINLAALVGLFGNESLSAAGTLSGRVPIRIEEGGISIMDGKLQADEEGFFSYKGKATDAAAQANEQASLAFRALKNFRYRVLEAGLDGPISGEMELNVLLEGNNPDVLNGTPFQFDITLNAELMNLIRNVTRGRQIEQQIREQLGDESR